MKPILSLLALCAALFFTGCASTGRPIDPQRVAYAVEDAAFIGSRVALLKNPEWRPAFESAVQALAVLEGKDEIGVADIVAIARTLHVKELKSDETALVIAGAELLLVNLDRQTIDLNKLAALKPVVSGFRKGLERGLAD